MKVNNKAVDQDGSSNNFIESDIQFFNEYEKCRELVNSRLSGLYCENKDYNLLLEAMRYSLLSGGKRIRAILCLKFCEASGGKLEDALDAACAVEAIHTYSLIHDDLPCMDNDDMRRGKQSNHIKYGVTTATLAGDALQASAFELLFNSRQSAETIMQQGKILACAAGPHGICGGQYLDLFSGKTINTSDDLFKIHELKTSALFIASAKLGVLSASGDKNQLHSAEEFARALGLAFQIRDDLLDETSTQEQLGKPIKSDKANKKITFASYYTHNECESMISELTEKAVKIIHTNEFKNNDFLEKLAKSLENRTR